jgi:hypothetical protein
MVRCKDTDVPAILGQFQVQQSQFPCKYLGLTLRVGRIKRADKVAGKLPR